MTTSALFSAAAVMQSGGGNNTSIGSDVVYTSSGLSVTSQSIGNIATTKAVFVQNNSTSSITISQTTTSQVFSTIPSSQLASETFAVIVGCSVAAAVLVAVIIILTTCCIVRPILRSRKKAARGHTVHHETIYGYKSSVTNNMEQQQQKAAPVISTTVRSTTSSENLYIMYSGHPTAATKTASRYQHITSSEYLPSAVFKPAVTAASTSALPGSHYHDNWYGRGVTPGSKEPTYGQQLANESRLGRESYGSVENFVTTPAVIGLNDSCVSINSTTPLYREKPESRDAANDDDFSTVFHSDQNAFSVTAPPVTDVPVHGRRPTVDDRRPANPAAAAGVSSKQSNKRPVASQLSSKSVVLTEDVWNSTVDIAFDSALSLHEPL